MTRPEFQNGVPSIIEVDWKDKAQLDRLQGLYGQFAGSVLQSLRNTDPNAPLDIVTFGKNWLQLFQTRDEPNNDSERAILAASKSLDPEKFGKPFFGDMWQLMRRYPGHTVQHLLAELYEGVQAGAVNPRIMEKLAVLDLSEADPILSESDFPGVEETPWGMNGVLPGTGTLIYHITSGYPRMIVADIESPDDESSATYYGFGEMKWD